MSEGGYDAGGDPPSGDGKSDSKSSSSDGTWYGMTISTSASTRPITIFDSGVGDKLTLNSSLSAKVNGKKGWLVNTDIGFNENGDITAVSENIFGFSMTFDLAHMGISAGLSISPSISQSFGIAFANGFHLTTSTGYTQGNVTNSMNEQYYPGERTFNSTLYMSQSIIQSGSMLMQPALAPEITPFFSY